MSYFQIQSDVMNVRLLRMYLVPLAEFDGKGEH